MQPLQRSSARRATAAFAVALALLGGCTADPEVGAGQTVTDLDRVTVSGKAGEKPSVQVPSPFSIDRTERRIIAEGSGALVARGQRVRVDYVGVNGADGQEFDTSFGRSDRNQFVLNQPGAIEGWVSGLAGVRVGSRVLVAVPPKDAYGVSGVPSAGIGSTDTLVFVIDVQQAKRVLRRATGDPVKPRAGMPTVKLDKAGAPTIALPNRKPPTVLMTHTLIRGRGAEVRKGQSITVQYSGMTWPGGRVIYDTWRNGDGPMTHSVGVGRLITGWEVGLIGKTVGSQVLLVVPPDQGYGATGQPELKIKGTDTLVFVVDILDAAN